MKSQLLNTLTYYREIQDYKILPNPKYTPKQYINEFLSLTDDSVEYVKKSKPQLLIFALCEDPDRVCNRLVKLAIDNIKHKSNKIEQAVILSWIELAMYFNGKAIQQQFLDNLDSQAKSLKEQKIHEMINQGIILEFKNTKTKATIKSELLTLELQDVPIEITFEKTEEVLQQDIINLNLRIKYAKQLLNKFELIIRSFWEDNCLTGMKRNLKIASVKEPERCIYKLKDYHAQSTDLKSKLCKICDLCRGSIICSSVEEVRDTIRVLDLLSKNENSRCVKFKNMFENQDLDSGKPDLGQKDFKYIFRVEQKDHIEFMELQVIFHTQLFYKAIDHKVYNVIRINLDELQNESSEINMLNLKDTFEIEQSKKLTNKINMRQSDGYMQAEATIVVPTHMKNQKGRAGVIFGNQSNNAKEPAINFELHDKGVIRVFWNNGEVNLLGSTDLRDGCKHVVAFERTRTQIQLLVDQKVEASGKGGSDVPVRNTGTWINCDWRDGGMPLRGDLLELKITGEEEFAWTLPPTLTHDIEMRQSDGYMKAEALIKIPKSLKDQGTRVGTIFGNFDVKPAINFEIHNSGSIRLFWNNGEVDLHGHSDLRDDKWHHVMFERKRDSTAIQVDGNIEGLAKGGSDIPPRKVGTWIGHDWRDGGMAFRGETLALIVQGENLFKWFLYHKNK